RDRGGGPRAGARVAQRRACEIGREHDAGAEHDARDSQRPFRAAERDTDLREPDHTDRSIQPRRRATARGGRERRLVVPERRPGHEREDGHCEPRDDRRQHDPLRAEVPSPKPEARSQYGHDLGVVRTRATLSSTRASIASSWRPHGYAYTV